MRKVSFYPWYFPQRAWREPKALFVACANASSVVQFAGSAGRGVSSRLPSTKYGAWLQARDKIAIAKVLAPSTVLRVIDQAIQVHGGAGVSNDVPLARLWAGARTLRLADGPDDVHLLAIAKMELAALAAPTPRL